MHLTHAYVHWLADVHSGGFAPAFTLSFHDSECSRKPPNAHSVPRSRTSVILVLHAVIKMVETVN